MLIFKLDGNREIKIDALNLFILKQTLALAGRILFYCGVNFIYKFVILFPFPWRKQYIEESKVFLVKI